MRADWTQPTFADAPGDLRPVLAGARLVALESDRQARTVHLRFVLPSDAGTPEAVFVVHAATHLLTFAYLPPAEPLAVDLPPEEAMATVGEWARQGLTVSADPLTFGTALVVERAFLHGSEGSSTLTVEGYGADAERLVWWDVRAAGATVEAI